MNTVFKTLMILLFLVSTSLYATQKQADNLSRLSASSLYNIDKQSLQTTIIGYVNNHPNLKALKIVEALSGETYLSLYKDENKNKFTETILKNMSDYDLFESESRYEGEKVGSVYAYFEKIKKNNQLNNKEISWVRNNPIITVAVVTDFPPYDILGTDNKLQGFHTDIINLINNKLSTNIRLVPFSSWKDAYNKTIEGDINAIFGLSWSKEREKNHFIYNTPYHFTGYPIIVKKDNNKIHSIEYLKDQKVAVEAETIFVDVMKEKVPSAKLSYGLTTEDTYKLVGEGIVNAVLSGHVRPELLEKYDLKVATEIYHKSSELYIGVNKKYPNIASILKKGINSISLKEMATLRKKWFEDYLKEKTDKFNKKTPISGIDLTSEEQNWITNNPIVKFAVMNYWNTNDNGDNIHIDMIKLFNKYSDLHVVPIKYDRWKDGFSDATNGKIIHGVMNLSWTKEREENNFYYTKPYNFVPSQLIVRGSNKNINNIKDLKNKTAYLREKSTANNTIKEKSPTTKIINLKNDLNMYKMLSSKKEADAILDYAYNKNMLDKYKLKIVQNIYDKYSEVSVGTSKKHPELYSIMNKIFKMIPKDDLIKLQNKDYSKKVDSSLVLSMKEHKWIKNNSTVNVIKFFDEPPFTLNKPFKQGYLYELLEYILKSAGLKINYVDGFNSYNSMINSLEDEEMDILTTFPTSLDLGKESNIVKTKSVLKTPFVIIGKSNENSTSKIEDLFGKKVAVVKGYAQDNYLSKFPEIRKVHIHNNDEGFEAIRSGKADYYVNNRANTEYILNKSFSTDLSILFELEYKDFPPFSISIAMNGKKKELVSIIEKALEQIPYKELRKIREKWIISNEYEKKQKLNLTKEERIWISNHPKIKVHNEKSWAPYNFYEKGRARGLSIDYIKALTQKAGLDVEFISGPTWDEFMNMVKKKDIDVMLNIVKSPKREKFLNFTNPYSELYQSLFIRKGEKPITRTEELFGKTFAVPKGFYYEEKLKEYPKIKLLKLNNTLECIEAVSFGKADALLDLTAVVNYYKSKHKINNVVVGGTLGWEGGSLPLNMGIRKDWPELVSILNKALRSLSDEEIDTIENKWLFNNSQVKNKLVDLTKEEKRWIRDNVVKVGIEEWAPVIFSHGGKDFDGITGDILRLIVEKTGLNIEVVNDLWDPLLEKFKRKELDLLPATYYTDERATYGLFSQSYYKMLDSIYIREDNTQINSMNDLIGKQVAIPKGFGTIPKIREKFPQIQIIETRDLSDSIRRVLRGEVDALYDGQIAVEYKSQEELIVGLKGIAQKSFSAAPIHFFSHIDKPILRDILNKALKDIPVHQINKIKSKWLIEKRNERIINGIETKKNDKNTWWLIITTVGVFLFLLLILLIITRFISNDFIAKSFGSVKFRIISLIILSVIIFMLSILVFLTLTENKKETLLATKSDLEFVLKTTQDRLDTWMVERKNFLLQMGRDAELVKVTKDLLKLKKDANVLRSSKELKKVREFFEKRKKEFGSLGFFIIDKDYISIASKRDNNIGTINLIAKYNEKLLEKVLKGETVFIPPIETDVAIKMKKENNKEHTMFFAIPIQDKDGNVIAIMTQRLDVEGKFSNIIQSGRIGQSGESYLFSRDAFMLTKSRFRNELMNIGLLKANEKEYEKIQIKDPGGNLIDGFTPTIDIEKRPLTKMAQSALSLDKKTVSVYSKVHSDIEGYRDYRGVNVFGAWIWYNEFGFGLTTEVDVKEALSGFYILRQNLLIITGLTLLLTVMATIMLIILGEKATRSVLKANNDLSKLLSSFDENVIASRSDLKGRVTYASKAFRDISGYSSEELIGKPHSTVRHPDTPKEVFVDLWKTIKSGKIWRGEVKNRRKNGSFYWVEVVITPEFDDENNIMGYSAIRQDITSRKEVEALSENLEIKVEERTSELKKQQQQFSSMASNVPGVIYRCKVDADWTMFYISSEIEKLSGYPVSDFINNSVRSFADIMYKDDIEPIAKLIQEQIDKGKKFLVDYRVIDKNGVIKWVRSQGQASKSDDDILWLDGVLFDVTEQRALEQLIKENTEQMTFVSQYANLGFWNFNPQLGDLFVNDIFVQMLGYDAKEVLMPGFEDKMFKPFKEGLAFWEHLLHPDDAKRTNEIITAHINGETDLYKVDYRMRRADGTWMWSTAIGRIAEYDEKGKPIRFNGVNIDIDENKRAQEAIADQKQYTDSIMNSQSNIVISTDGIKLRTANKSFFDFYEIDCVEEFLENFGDCICDTFDIDAPKEFIQKMMGEEKWIEYVYSRPEQIHKAIIERDGVSHIFTITSDRFEFAGETLEVAVFTDITEIESIRKNIETILSNIMLPVLITSKKDRTILYANDYASKQYETPIEKLVGSSIDSVYTSVDQKDEILTIMKDQGYVENLEEKYKTKTGKEFIGLLSVKPILYDGDEAFIGMVVDITDQKNIEDEIRRIHKHTQSSIEYASLIQHSLIPSNDLFRKYYDDYFTIWHPKDIVGGDIYLFDELRNDNECLLMVIDCTGHGVPGAFVTMLVKAIERQVSAIIASDENLEVSPAWILQYFNQTMKKLLKQEDENAISNAGFDGAVLYYNRRERIIRFAGAELPLFYIEDGEFKTIRGNRHSIGYKKSDADYEFNEHLLEAKEGMQIYLSTDGYFDQNGGEKGFPFGKKRFQKILEEYKDYSFADQQEVLLNEMQSYQKEEERNDDVSIVGIKIGKINNNTQNKNESWVI